MNILGLDPAEYRLRWAEFREVAEYAEVVSPTDQALLWREMTGGNGLIEWPVPIEHFITSPYYVGSGLSVRPRIMGVAKEFWEIDAGYELLLFLAGIGCVAEGTIIHDPVSGESAPIETLSEPGWVETGYGACWRSAARFGGEADLYRVSFSNGSEVSVTGDHRFLTPQGWMALSEMRQRGVSVVASPSVGPVGGSWIGSGGELRSDRGEHAFEVAWVGIASIVGIGSGRFWDIEVPDAGHYVAEGVFHSNSGKSFCGSLFLIYALYLLSIMQDPIAYMNRFPGVSLSEGSEIVLLNASAAGAEQGEKIVYGDVLARVTKSPYFSSMFPAQPNKRSELVFPNRVRYAPTTSDWRSVLGWNVFGFAIDEAAFGKETERADYVAELFNALNQRRRSRFGMLGFGALLTSPGHDESYVEGLSRQGETWDSSMMVVRMNTWDAKEEIRDGAEVFVFDAHRDAMRIVEDGLTFVRPGQLMRKDETFVSYRGTPDGPPGPGEEIRGLDLMVIPKAYQAEFRRDAADSILKYGAYPQRAKSPWFLDTAPINDAAVLPDLVVGPEGARRTRAQQPDVEWRAIVSDSQDTQTMLHALTPDLLALREDWRTAPWHVAVDPGLNRGRKGDAAGIAVGRIVDTLAVTDRGVTRVVNRYAVPLVAQVIAPEGGEIYLTALSKLILALKAEGINITSFSYDSFQSAGSIQELTWAGLVTAGIKINKETGLPEGFGKPFSVDRTPDAHQELKEAINEGRIQLPDYWILRQELGGLEAVWGKAPDHPRSSSKDTADPVAGVVGYLAKHGHAEWVDPHEETVDLVDQIARTFEDDVASFMLD